MRKLFYSSVMLAVILSLTSCSDADSSSQQMSISENSQTTSDDFTSSTDASTTTSFNLAGNPDDPMLVPFTSISIEEDQVRSLFEPFENFSISDDFNINIPNVNILENYKTVVKTTQNVAEYVQEFTDIFQYLFPGKTMNEYALFYDSEKGSSEERWEMNEDGEEVMVSPYHLVKDDYDAIMSGDEGEVWFIYDENRMLRYGYGDKATEDVKNNPVRLDLGVCMGYGYSFLETNDYFDRSTGIATYPPDSTEKFMLSGEEVAICDAVQYYENFVNKIPQVYREYEEHGGIKETPLETRVVEVDVCQLANQQFGYHFIVTKCHNGVLFDYMRDGTSHTDMGGAQWGTTMADAYMIRKDSIAGIDRYYRCQEIEYSEKLEKYLPLETAVDIVANKLTKSVTFEVKKLNYLIFGNTS